MTLLADAVPITFVLTTDRSRAKPFYETVLGLSVLAEDDFAVTFALAGGTTLRLTSFPKHIAQEPTVLGWTVADLHAAMAELQERGVTFRIYEGLGQDADGVWEAPGGGAKVVWFADPDGNVLSLTEF